MSKFHEGDKVRLVDRDGLFEQFWLTEDNGFDVNAVYTVERVDTGTGSAYGYDGPTYLVEGGDQEWGIPVDVMRPAEIVALTSTLGTVYIAGPMRNIPEFNFPAFIEAAAKWRALGFDVISPAEHDIEGGFDVAGLDGTEDLAEIGFDLNEALLWDLEQVAKADGLILLSGWEGSSGARAEIATAAALGKWVIEDAFGGEPTPASHYVTPLARPERVDTSGEVRITGSTGAQKGQKLARFNLIPVGPLMLLAEHFGKGAQKYAARNWELGTEWDLNFDAMMRHAWAFWGGEDIDPETGSPHMVAVAWHAMVLTEFMSTHPELDTRPTTERDSHDD